jgi:hypothetical protein
MTPLRDLLETSVESGTVPGAAALVARGDDVEIAGAGEVERESIVRIASITKPITAAAIMILVDEGSFRSTTRSRAGCPNWRRRWSCGRPTAQSTTSCLPRDRSPSTTS